MTQDHREDDELLETQDAQEGAPVEAQEQDVGPREDAAPGPASDDGGPRAGGDWDETPEEMSARIKELTGDLQRLQAEYVNYKRRVDRDRDLVLQNARYTVLSALLPILDDIDRAREHEELTGGFKVIAESLERIVAGEGLVKFGEKGDEFDPTQHEALMHSLSPHVTRTTCDTIVQAGYRFGDRVVRPAKVLVVDPDPAAAPVVRSEDAGPAEAGPAEAGAGGDGETSHG